jgi:hypothetical protein
VKLPVLTAAQSDAVMYQPARMWHVLPMVVLIALIAAVLGYLVGVQAGAAHECAHLVAHSAGLLACS